MHFNLLEVILCVFFTALLISVLFRHLKLSAILGYLVVGAIVGPNMLGIITDLKYVNILAEFGIVLLMFTVGLEFSVSKLYSLRNIVLVVGSLQVLLTILFISVIGPLLGLDLLASLILGSIIAMSSTALVIKQLNDQFELNSKHGMNAVAILLFQDLAVIPIIILVTNFGSNVNYNLTSMLFWALIKGLLAILLIFILGRWVIKPLFRFIAKARAIELFTLTVLLVTLTSAWITETLGLSYALGAFLGGMMLAETEFRYQIEIEIRPFRDILLGLFFITVGMLTNVAVWYHSWLWVLLIAFLLIVGKMFLITVLTRITGSYYSTAVRTGIVLAQGGEFGFAILSLAMNKKIFTNDFQQIILGALLISIALAPVLIRFNKRIAELVLSKKHLHDSEDQRVIVDQAQTLRNHIIICGYGRVGQHIARVLDKINFPFIGIDLDAELIQRASLAGDNVIYGDSSHPGILRKAGIENAKVVVICLQDHRAAAKIFSIVHERYPNLPSLLRCRDKAELKQFRKMGAVHIITEIFETSLSLSTYLLQLIKLPPTEISKIIQDVRSTDYNLLHRVFVGNLPEDSFSDQTTLHEQLSPILISKNSYAINHKLSEIHLKKLGVEVVALRRGKEKHLKPHGNIKILEGDIVVLFGSVKNLEIAEKKLLKG